MDVKSEPLFDLGDYCYLQTPESDLGFISDRRYYPDIDRWEYLVLFNHNVPSVWYYDIELSRHKRYL